jgi:CRP-like cAMP-binding protein
VPDPPTSLCADTACRQDGSPLVRKLCAFVALSEAELTALQALHQRRRSFDLGQDLLLQGQPPHSAYILADGWTCSYKLLPKGTRQIVDFQVPGDFLGLRSILFRACDHNVEAITSVEVSEVSVNDLIDAFARAPRLAAAVLWAASREEAVVAEHLVDVGRRTPLERTAHFILELGARLTLVGLGTKVSFTCPLSQYSLADALGLTAVHLNRVLRQLREEGLLTFRHGQVTIHNFDGLVRLAAFDTAYLDQEGQPLR